MKQIDIEWLDAGQYRILKEIIIFGTRGENDVELGRIFYKRKLANSYCLKASEDKAESNLASLEKCLHGYPNQDNYPADKIDEMIFSAVCDQFPRSVTRSDTFLHAADVERLQILKQVNVVQCPMFFTPGIWRMNEIYNLPEGAKQGFRADINIYTSYDSKVLQNHVFNAKFDLKDRHFLGGLKNIEFE